MLEQDPIDQKSLMHGVRLGNNPPGPDRNTLYVLVGVIILLAVIGGGLYIHSQRQLRDVENQLNKMKVDPNALTKEQNKQLIEKISQIIVLPSDEEPTIATVSDLDKLKGKPFFAQAELGDKVLIYNKAKKAILYRPSTNKIIELAPFADDGSIPTNAP